MVWGGGPPVETRRHEQHSGCPCPCVVCKGGPRCGWHDPCRSAQNPLSMRPWFPPFAECAKDGAPTTISVSAKSGAGPPRRTTKKFGNVPPIPSLPPPVHRFHRFSLSTVYTAPEFFLKTALMSEDTMADLSAPLFHPILTDTGNGHTFMMLGTTMRLIATAADTGGRYTVAEQITPAGWGPPRHIHSREDEIFYIFEGTYELHVGDERRTVSAGACAILPRGIPHGFRNVVSTPGRLLFIITPGGLEDYFLAVAKFPPPPNLAQLAELARPFGLTLLPPGA